MLLFADAAAMGYLIPALPAVVVDSTGEPVEFTDVLRRTNSRGRRMGKDVAVRLSHEAGWEATILKALEGCPTVPRLIATLGDDSPTYVSLWLAEQYCLT